MIYYIFTSIGQTNITIIEPKPIHYYQPLWTLVGAGIKRKEDSVIATRDIVPKKVNLIVNRVKTINPLKNEILMEDGEVVIYDYLVVAAG